MNIKQKVNCIIKELEVLYPDAKCSLEAGNDPWKLLIMTRLSAQCTDARVNVVSKELFRVFPTAISMAEGDISELERIVYPCGLYKTKAKSIKETSKIIAEKFGGKIPDTMEELLSLPGVGRKTANLVLGDIFGKGGIVADTHCMRISERLGLSEGKNPLKVERTLDPIVPKDKQSALCHRFVLFGREYCMARGPKCNVCPLGKKNLCDFAKY